MLIKFRHTTMATLKDDYWYDRSGIYYIRSNEEFKVFRDIVNKSVTKVGGIAKKTVKKANFSGETVYLCCDIDLGNEEWEPIAGNYDTYGFCGTFDGQGHRVKGLSITKNETTGKSIGLFGVVGGTIKNLSVEGSINYSCTTRSDYGGTGGIVGTLYGGKVENCQNYVNIYDSRNTPVVGGIVGLTYLETEINNCKNYGTIEARHTQSANNYYAGCGGIVGTTESKLTVSNSINYASIIGDSYMRGTGGIVGSAYLNKKSILIQQCANKGGVQGTQSAGGILGSAYGQSTYIYSTIKNSYNCGAIYAGGTVGGVIGSFIGGYKNTTSEIGYSSSAIQFCYNIGELTGGIVGGLAGTYTIQTEKSFYYKIENSFNLGKLNKVTDSSIVGGVAGYITSGTFSGQYIYCDSALSSILYPNVYSENPEEETQSFSYSRTNNGFIDGLINYVKDISIMASTAVFATYTDTGYLGTGETIGDAKWGSSWNFSTVWAVVEDINDGLPCLQHEIA